MPSKTGELIPFPAALVNFCAWTSNKILTGREGERQRGGRRGRDREGREGERLRYRHNRERMIDKEVFNSDK